MKTETMMKNQLQAMVALTMVAAVSGCAGGGGHSGFSGPTVSVLPADAPLRPGYEPSPCGTLYGYPVPCMSYLPLFPGDPGYGEPVVPTIPSPPPGPIFKSWSELPPLVSAQFDAIAGRVSYQQQSLGYISTTNSSFYQGGTVMIEGPKYDSNGELNLLPSLWSNRGESFSRTDPSSRFTTLAPIGQPGIDFVWTNWLWGTGPQAASPFSDKNTDEIAVVANPRVLGWNYQSFGVWDDHAFGSNRIELRSYGAATPAEGIPTTGSATFSGKLAGLYVGPGATGSIATADLTVNANFSTRSLSFASSGTTLTRDLATASAAPNLNLGGTLIYSPASNTFTGTLTNAGGTMSGSSTGRYYGPAAQELGGVFTLKSATGVETFAGGYGGKR